jgi:hypothetical protein
MPERDLVFVTYTHADQPWLEPIRSALKPYDFYENFKVKVWTDQEIKVGDPWHEEIQSALDRTAVAVLLISQYYFGSAYIRDHELPKLMQDAAAGKIILVCVPVGEVDQELLSSNGLDRYQFALKPDQPLSSRKGSGREKAVVPVAVAIKDAYRRKIPPRSLTPAHTAPRVAAALEFAPDRASGQVAGLGLLHGVPALDERHYVERGDVLAGLKQQIVHGTGLLAGVTSARRAESIGLHGMGGIGKTVLAQAFCHDEEVRAAFPDGIYWLTLGQQPSLLAEQTRLLGMLRKDAPLVESISQATDLLGESLFGKRALLVIDDLWRAEHFRAFDAVGERGRVLITTRDASLLNQIGAEERCLNLLDEPLALQLLAEWAGTEVGTLPVSAARGVARLCGYLPLALALSGAQVADGVAWDTLVEQLEQGKLDFLDHDYGSVFDCLGRSLDALPEQERVRYLELAVFPEDARIPLQAIARLWRHSGGLTEAQTEKLLGRLQRKALLKHMQTVDAEFISFHDLQLDFLRIRAESPSVLNARLLDAYRATLDLPEGAVGWTQLPPDEPYFWNRLAFHLAEAGRHAELEELLLDLSWICARLTAATTRRKDGPGTDVNALLADYEQIQDSQDASFVQRALRMSRHVLARHPEQVGSQLYGRLGTSESPRLQALCNRAVEDSGELVPYRPALNPPGSLVSTFDGHEDSVYGALLLADGRRRCPGREMARCGCGIWRRVGSSRFCVATRVWSLARCCWRRVGGCCPGRKTGRCGCGT